jgi:hypothetical protein
VIVLHPQGEHPLEGGERTLALPQFQKPFAQPGQGVFVIRLERQPALERAAGPGVLFACEVGVPFPDVKLDCTGIESETVLQDGECE